MAGDFVESLARLRWRLRMAIVCGRLDSCRPSQRAARAAIERQFSKRDSRAIERRFFEYRRRRTLLDGWIQQGMTNATRVVQIDGLGHLEQALSGGSGAILASVHFGHARLIKPILHAHGRPALLVGAAGSGSTWPSVAAEDLPIALNLRPHLAALQENKPLIVLVDGRGARSLIQIRVQGVGVSFAPGTMRIARAAGAPVLPAFVVDEGTLHDPLALRLVIHEPLRLQRTQDPAADVLENLRRFARVYAEELGRNPHNLNWSFVEAESGNWNPPPNPWLWEINEERIPDIAGGSVERWTAHGQ